jgi:hypothetical protein
MFLSSPLHRSFSLPVSLPPHRSSLLTACLLLMVSDSHFLSFDYEAAQRRAYAESRAKVFLEIQSDLEILTETLSGLLPLAPLLS